MLATKPIDSFLQAKLFQTKHSLPNLCRTKLLLATLCLTTFLSACSDPSLSKKIQHVEEALSAEGLTLNEHYEIVKGGVQHDSEEIIVAEYFWYGCSHCYDAEPIVQEWKSRIANNAKIIRVPVVWGKNMDLHAQVFYMGDALLEQSFFSENTREVLHTSLFATIMSIPRDATKAQHRKQLESHFARFGVGADLFEELLSSDDIAASVKRAAEWQKRSDISATPTFIVDGNFKMSPELTKKKRELIRYGNKIVKAVHSAKLAENTPDA